MSTDALSRIIGGEGFVGNTIIRSEEIDSEFLNIIGAINQDRADKLERSGSIAMVGDLDVGDNKLVRLAQAFAAGHAVEYAQWIDQIAIDLAARGTMASDIEASKIDKDGTLAMSANLDLGTNKVVNLSPGSQSGDSIEYDQLLDDLALKLSLMGGTMSGPIDMGTNKITGLSQGSSEGEAVSLDSNSKIPALVLPASIVGAVVFQGVWDAALNSPPLVSSLATNGHYYRVNSAGNTTINGISDWEVGDWIIGENTTWKKIDNTDKVMSVAGRSGNVILSKNDVGLGNVANALQINFSDRDNSTDLGGALPSSLKVPTQAAIQGFVSKSTDTTLGGETPSSTKLPVEAAIKSYIDSYVLAAKPSKTFFDTAQDTSLNQTLLTMSEPEDNIRALNTEVEFTIQVSLRSSAENMIYYNIDFTRDLGNTEWFWGGMCVEIGNLGSYITRPIQSNGTLESETDLDPSNNLLDIRITDTHIITRVDTTSNMSKHMSLKGRVRYQ